MSYLNSVSLIGFVGSDPEQRQAKGNGSKFTVPPVATQRSWKNADEEWSSNTEWHRIVLIWNLLLRCHNPAQVLLDGGTAVIGELLRLSALEQVRVVSHRVSGWAVASLTVWDRERQINAPPGR